MIFLYIYLFFPFLSFYMLYRGWGNYFAYEYPRCRAHDGFPWLLAVFLSIIPIGWIVALITHHRYIFMKKKY